VWLDTSVLKELLPRLFLFELQVEFMLEQDFVR